MSDNLTDSQRRLLEAMKREVIAVGDEIKCEIEKLRQEQRELHERGENENYHRLRRTVIRAARSLLALFDKDADQ